MEKQRQIRITTHLNAIIFRSCKDSLMITNKLRWGTVVEEGREGDNEDLLIKVVVVVAMVFFFLDWRDRKALELAGGFSLKRKWR
jgi:hypothetical protein